MEFDNSVPSHIQAETSKHTKFLSQEAAHLKRLGLSEEDISQRLDRRYLIMTKFEGFCKDLNGLY